MFCFFLEEYFTPLSLTILSLRFQEERAVFLHRSKNKNHMMEDIILFDSSSTQKLTVCSHSGGGLSAAEQIRSVIEKISFKLAQKGLKAFSNMLLVLVPFSRCTFFVLLHLRTVFRHFLFSCFGIFSWSDQRKRKI